MVQGENGVKSRRDKEVELIKQTKLAQTMLTAKSAFENPVAWNAKLAKAMQN